jgi:colicin import membrane protein
MLKILTRMSNTDHNTNLIDYNSSLSHMASLEALSKSYGIKKAEVSKLRKQVENKLKEATSKKRRSSSGLVALDKKKEELTRAKDHIIQVLNQHLSQKASIERLKIAAEERLKHEENAKDEAKQQSEYGPTEEKANAVQRLQYIDEKIAELHAELKERESNQIRLEKEIESSEKEKIKIEELLKKQIHAKPALVELLKVGTKEESALRPRFEALQKIETKVSQALSAVQKNLAIIAAQKRKRMAIIAAQKRKRMAIIAAQKRKRMAIIAAQKRKKKVKVLRKLVKRKVAKSKTKSRIKKVVKRKALKRKIKSRRK